MKRSDFGDDFIWGAATASYQIEGGWNEDGKGESVWDRFSHTKGKIERGETGDVSCDFYHKFRGDIGLFADLGLKGFRFSLSWPRLFPNGTGQVNQKGVDFYRRVIDRCLEVGTEPWPTLFHWDTPQALQDKGGFVNRDMVGWFSEYVDFCTRTFGDTAKKWMIINEPLSYTALGYIIGFHAPGKRLKIFAPIHHTTLCQAEGGRIAKANIKDGVIGTTFSCAPMEPRDPNSPADVSAAARADAFFNRLFIEPSLGMGYPYGEDGLPALKRIEKYFKPGDDEKVKFDFDFVGVQNYSREIIKAAWYVPFFGFLIKPAKKRGVPLTEMGWEIHPESIYKMCKKFATYPGVKKIYVTENGAAFPDTVENGRVHDPQRTKYLQNFIAQVLKAKKEGINVCGYFIWSFLDNFEWALGYRPRFGIVHVDFDSLTRTVKDSGLWVKDFLTGKE